MANRIKGFPRYNHPEALMVCDARNEAQVVASFTAGINTFGTDQAEYDDDLGYRALVPTTANMRFTYTFPATVNEFSISWETEAKFFANIDIGNPTLNKVLFSVITNGPAPHLRRNAPATAVMGWGSITSITVPAANVLQAMQGYIPVLSSGPDFVKCSLSCKNGKWVFYLNGLPIAQAKATAAMGASAMYHGVVWGGSNNTSVNGPLGVWSRNVQVMNQGIDLRIDPQYRRFAWFTDSFGNYGQYNGTAGFEIQGNTDDHFAPSDPGLNLALTSKGISGFIPVCTGLLNLAGYSPASGRHEYYGIGGGSAIRSQNKSLYLQVEAMLNNGVIQSGTYAGKSIQGSGTGFGTRAPDVCFAIFGANNVTGASVTNYADIFNGYVDAIQLAVDNGCKRFILSECAPTAAQGGDYANAQCLTNIQTFNQAVEDAAALFDEAFVSRVYNKFGGQSGFDPYDWSPEGATSSDRHPATYGLHKWGQWMAETFISSVS